jgi:hypothetical protein
LFLLFFTAAVGELSKKPSAPGKKNGNKTGTLIG